MKCEPVTFISQEFIKLETFGGARYLKRVKQRSFIGEGNQCISFLIELDTVIDVQSQQFILQVLLIHQYLLISVHLEISVG